MKTHYWGKRDGYAFCGTCVPTTHLTAHLSSVTCKLCLRHVEGGERKPGGEKRRPKGVKPGPKPSREAAIGTAIHNAVERLLDFNARKRRPVPDVLVITPPSNKAHDSLMRRAFVDYEGELAVRVAALKLAMQGWEAADRDDLASAGEGLRTEAQALVDYLEGVKR